MHTETCNALTFQDLYEPVFLGDELAPTCLCVRSKYNVDESGTTGTIPDKRNNASSKGGNAHEHEGSKQQLGIKDIFFFADGSVIFWSIPELERKTVLDFLRQNSGIEEADGSYDEDTIFEESEMMTYSYIDSEQNSGANHKSTHLDTRGYQIRLLKINDNNRTYLEKYAFSNAIAASVKLGALEAQLDRFIDSIEFLSEDMKRGRAVKVSRNAVLMKTGEIFALRHVLNLSSDLLDTPDFYWDRENLEILYHATCAHLAVAKRIRVTNEKISHCCELLDLVTNHLNDHHHTKLEWYIIILIMIEVIFEVFHFTERFLH